MKYKAFLWTFILSVMAGIVLFIFYIKAIFSITRGAYNGYDPDPFTILGNIFTPGVIISLVVMAATGLAYRIMAIVWIAKNKVINSSEKALWIVGFILLGFVTAIVFLILAKSRRLLEDDTSPDCLAKAS